jgi:hypothetical protein
VRLFYFLYFSFFFFLFFFFSSSFSSLSAFLPASQILFGQLTPSLCPSESTPPTGLGPQIHIYQTNRKQSRPFPQQKQQNIKKQGPEQETTSNGSNFNKTRTVQRLCTSIPTPSSLTAPAAGSNPPGERSAAANGT